MKIKACLLHTLEYDDWIVFQLIRYKEILVWIATHIQEGEPNLPKLPHIILETWDNGDFKRGRIDGLILYEEGDL